MMEAESVSETSVDLKPVEMESVSEMSVDLKPVDGDGDGL